MKTVDETFVRGGKLVVQELITRDPLEGRTTERLGLIRLPVAPEKIQAHSFLWIIVLHSFDQLADRNFDAKFFTQFANETGLEALVALTFAAGKFPKSAQVRISMALSDE